MSDAADSEQRLTAWVHECGDTVRKVFADDLRAVLAELGRLREYALDQPSRFAAVVHQRTAAEAERDIALAEVERLRRRAEEIVAFLTDGERRGLAELR